MKTKKQAQTVAWQESEFGSGPFKGTFWGTRLHGEFFMIVRRSPRGAGTYFQVWRDGVVHDEVNHPTLAAAQSFAERLATKAE